MQADHALLQQMERLLNGSNVHQGRTLMCRYQIECWLGKRPEVVASLHNELSSWTATELRKKNLSLLPVPKAKAQAAGRRSGVQK